MDEILINCWNLGHDVDSVFGVRILKNTSVDELKEVIKKKMQNELDHIDANKLRIWKLRDPLSYDDIVTTLGMIVDGVNIPNAEKLNPMKKLSYYFSEPPASETLHLVIQAPPPAPRSRRLSTISPLSDKEIIQKHVEAAKAKERPSTAATVKGFPLAQANSPILNGRPFATRSTPVHIYHDVFTTFTSIYNDRAREIPLCTQEEIFELCQASSELYQTGEKSRGEDKRFKTLLPIYTRMLDESMPTVVADDSQADAVITTRTSDGLLLLRGLFEAKNEIGAGGSDPNIQGCLSYIKYWSMDVLRATRDKCCCPSFVIAIPGPWIAVHGAVLSDAGWIIQPLTDLVNLQFDPYDDGGMHNIARLFLALRESLKELDTFYKQIENEEAPMLWPSIREYQGVQFEYLGRLLPEYLSKAVFKARVLNGNLIVVKFTNSYGVDAHRLLEKENLAPKLRYFSGGDEGFKKPCGLEMVVMDFIPDTNSPLTDQGREDVKRAVRILHDAGYVFGDLRLANILNLKDGHAMMVDFDWSGLEGQVVYPMGLNKEIQWPPGSGTGRPIEKSHDIFMLQKLCN